MVVTALIALVIGLLFPWWAGAVVFVLGLALVFKQVRREAVERHAAPENEKSAEELLEWNEWEVTHGPSAPGVTNPSHRDD